MFKPTPQTFTFKYKLYLTFPINYNWSREQLCSLKERVGHNRFKHGHMENWMNRAYGLWKMEGEQ